MKLRISWTSMRFVVVGLTNTVVALAAIYFLKWSVGLSNTVANILGYSFGLATSFLLNRQWTFCYVGPWLPALVRFFLVFAIAYAANLGTVLILIERFAMNGYVVQVFGVPPYMALFYLGSRYFVFPERRTGALKPDLRVVSPSDSAAASAGRSQSNFVGLSQSKSDVFG